MIALGRNSPRRVYRGVIPVGRPYLVRLQARTLIPLPLLSSPGFAGLFPSRNDISRAPRLPSRQQTSNTDGERGRLKPATNTGASTPSPSHPPFLHRSFRPCEFCRLLIQSNFRATHYGPPHKIDKKQKFCDPVALRDGNRRDCSSRREMERDGRKVNRETV